MGYNVAIAPAAVDSLRSPCCIVEPARPTTDIAAMAAAAAADILHTPWVDIAVPQRLYIADSGQMPQNTRHWAGMGLTLRYYTTAVVVAAMAVDKTDTDTAEAVAGTQEVRIRSSFRVQDRLDIHRTLLPRRQRRRMREQVKHCLWC